MAKKTLQCEDWLNCILNESLPKLKHSSIENTAFANRLINLVDSSCVKQEGINGAILRIHMNYSLTGRHMDETLVTDRHTAESFTPFTINQGNIYIADAGFGKGKNFEYIVSRQADALLRVTPNCLSLAKDSKGKDKINMAKELNTRDNVVDFRCYVHTENKKYIPVRIIASRLPEDKVVEAIKRKKRKSQQNQSILKDETLIYAQWVILMTSLDECNSAEEILNLYRVRWQIELLFKRIKQFFKITRIRAATVQHSKTLILLWLIAWAIIEKETVAAEAFLMTNKANMSLHSTWNMCSFFFQRFKAIITCFLAFCYDVGLINVYKRLRNHNSSRINQFASFCFLESLCFCS